jgi:hypothetical protein
MQNYRSFFTFGVFLFLVDSALSIEKVVSKIRSFSPFASSSQNSAA